MTAVFLRINRNGVPQARREVRERSLCPFASPGFCDTSVDPMKQVVIVFHLPEGSEPEATRLATTDPPFNPAEAGCSDARACVVER
jgi:hypothetical protein